jgi:hypothetical protein
MSGKKDKTKRAVRGRRENGEQREPPEVYQVVIECRDEAEQREMFERMRGEGRRVRLLVL